MTGALEVSYEHSVGPFNSKKDREFLEYLASQVGMECVKNALKGTASRSMDI
jgi:hypothetical protein